MKIFAQALAGADSKEQAEFFNVFAVTLTYMCKNSQFGVGMQSYELAKGLHFSAVECLRDIVATWDYQQESARDTSLKLKDVRDELRKVESELDAKRRALEAE